MTALVLSGSHQETQRFAKQKKLGYGIRHAVNSNTIRGTRPTEIHILPSYAKRRDLHSLNAELRQIRRRCPRAPVAEYDFDKESGVWQARDEVTLDKTSRGHIHYVPADDEKRSQDRLDTLEALAADIDEAEHTATDTPPAPEPVPDHVGASPDPAPVVTAEKDTSRDAVPGQTALEEHLEDDVPDWMRDA